MIKELKTLCDECRCNCCIEHATCIMEETKAPENLSKKIANISITGTDKKVYCFVHGMSFYFFQSFFISKLSRELSLFSVGETCGEA